jgi:CO/xanthine dehydrogenase FAD-binding subunit
MSAKRESESAYINRLCHRIVVLEVAQARAEREVERLQVTVKSQLAQMMRDIVRAEKAEAALAGAKLKLHEIAEEWAGAECGEPVHAQEAYAIALAKRMYLIAVEGRKP